MTTQKIFMLFLLLLGGAVAYHLTTDKGRPSPPNERVNEQNFAQLRNGMSAVDVEDILGAANRTTSGELLQVQRLESNDLKCTIEEALGQQSDDVMKAFHGPNDESIRLLFSAKDGTLTAGEYRISNFPVLYRGPRTSNRSKSYAAIATGRSTDPEEKRKQKENLARYQRRKKLENTSTNTFFGNASPDDSAASSRPSELRASEMQPAKTELKQPAESPRSPERVTPAPAIAAKMVVHRPGPPRIELPSGKVLTDTVPAFEPPPQWQETFFPKGAIVFVDRRTDLAVQGVASLSKSKLHGATAAFYDGGRLETVAFYAEGKLHGPLRLWTDQKQPLLYAEYKNGNKHGLVCLYRDQAPWLVQEWDSAKLRQESLVGYDGDAPKASPATDPAVDAEALAQAQQQLKELEEEIRRNENKLKSHLVDWTRKEDRKTKQRRSTEPGAAKSLEQEVLWRTALRKSRD